MVPVLCGESRDPTKLTRLSAWLLAVGLLTFLGLATVASPVAAQGPRWAYSYGSAFCERGTELDPVNVIFLGASTWPTLDYHWANWDLPEWNWFSDNPGQTAPDYYDACKGMVRDRATNSGDGIHYYSNRYHARWLEYGFEDRDLAHTRDWHIHVTAHHEERGFAASPDGYVYPCGHAITSDGFNQARDEVVRGFVAQGHSHVDYRYVGNVKAMGQCNGTWVASNGYVSYISLRYPAHYGGGRDE